MSGVQDTVTPVCQWCGRTPAAPFVTATPHAHLSQDVCADCQEDALQAVWAVRHRARELRSLQPHVVRRG